MIEDRNLNVTLNGYFSYDMVRYDSFHRLGPSVVGRIKYQNRNYAYQGINGILGLGPSSFDNAFSDSFMNQIINYDDIDAVFSM